MEIFEPDVGIVDVLLNLVNPLMRNGVGRDDERCA